MVTSEGVLNIAGGLVELLTGFPDFEIFLFMDKGFLYVYLNIDITLI